MHAKIELRIVSIQFYALKNGKKVTSVIGRKRATVRSIEFHSSYEVISSQLTGLQVIFFTENFVTEKRLSCHAMRTNIQCKVHSIQYAVELFPPKTQYFASFFPGLVILGTLSRNYRLCPQ